jgi:hypothetical protein
MNIYNKNQKGRVCIMCMVSKKREMFLQYQWLYNRRICIDCQTNRTANAQRFNPKPISSETFAMLERHYFEKNEPHSHKREVLPSTDQCEKWYTEWDDDEYVMSNGPLARTVNNVQYELPLDLASFVIKYPNGVKTRADSPGLFQLKFKSRFTIAYSWLQSASYNYQNPSLMTWPVCADQWLHVLSDKTGNKVAVNCCVGSVDFGRCMFYTPLDYEQSICFTPEYIPTFGDLLQVLTAPKVIDMARNWQSIISYFNTSDTCQQLTCIERDGVVDYVLTYSL